MNASIHLVEHQRLHAQAVVRAQQLRREAVAGFGGAFVRTVSHLVHRLRQGGRARPFRTLEA